MFSQRPNKRARINDDTPSTNLESRPTQAVDDPDCAADKRRRSYLNWMSPHRVRYECHTGRCIVWKSHYLSVGELRRHLLDAHADDQSWYVERTCVIIKRGSPHKRSLRCIPVTSDVGEQSRLVDTDSTSTSQWQSYADMFSAMLAEWEYVEKICRWGLLGKHHPVTDSVQRIAWHMFELMCALNRIAKRDVSAHADRHAVWPALCRDRNWVPPRAHVLSCAVRSGVAAHLHQRECQAMTPDEMVEYSEESRELSGNVLMRHISLASRLFLTHVALRACRLPPPQLRQLPITLYDALLVECQRKLTSNMGALPAVNRSKRCVKALLQINLEMVYLQEALGGVSPHVSDADALRWLCVQPASVGDDAIVHTLQRLPPDLGGLVAQYVTDALGCTICMAHASPCKYCLYIHEYIRHSSGSARSS